MKNGFLKVALSNIPIIIADPLTNVKTIIEKIHYLNNKNVKIFLTPELSLISNSCNDLLFNANLNYNLNKSIKILINETKNIDMLIIVGTSLMTNNILLNVCVCLFKGKIIGIIPKTNLSNNEIRYYNNYNDIINIGKITLLNDEFDLTNKLIINDPNFSGLSMSLVFGNLLDQYNYITSLKQNGVNIILNPCNYIIHGHISPKYISNKLSMISRETNTIIMSASNGIGESKINEICLGYNAIFECGEKLGQFDIFNSKNEIITEIDFNKSNLLNLKHKHKRNNIIEFKNFKILNINFKKCETSLTRKIPKNPFLYFMNFTNDSLAFNQIFNMQIFALKNKLISSKSKGVIIALSGGLDSTLALIIAHQCCIDLNINLLALPMPGFGTSNNSYNNSNVILKKLNIKSKCIAINNSVKQHFIDIEHSINNKNIVYENAQARERTQIALDISNQLNYLFVGTSNLSEIALGWTTFAGDHISHYAINSGIPKTIIKELLLYITSNTKEYLCIKNVINNILKSPISPELIKNQRTEDIIGPYELHDFFIYNFINYNFSINKIYKLACYSFKNIYTNSEIQTHLTFFIKRFFSQQFKRNCCIEGPKIFDISFSPYNDFILTSDLNHENITNSFLNK